MKSLYARGSLVFSGVLVLIGVAILVETMILGGGIGLLFGALFVAAGLGRVYLSSR